MNDDTIDLNLLSMDEKIKIATELGEQAGSIISAALNEANDKLKKYGYAMSVDLNFHSSSDKELTN